MQFCTASLIQKEIIARDVLQFRISRPQDFAFAAGQFVQFRVPHQESFVLRSFSIASPPAAPYLEFCLKVLLDGKASRYFSEMPLGSEVHFAGPEGRFVVGQTHQPTKVFVATGTGLAPVASMIEDRLQVGGDAISLLFGVHAEPDLFWTERLERWAKLPGFAYRLTLSHPDAPAAWPGLTGRVTEHVAADAAADYYICGNVAMVKDVRLLLVGQGVSPSRIHFEIF